VNKSASGSHEKWYTKVLEKLIEDPTKSIRDIASELGTYRQKVWRKKKKMEDDNVIWGYTAVVNESKLNGVMYVILMKMTPMTKELADIITRRLIRQEPREQNIRLLNVLYVNGEFDLLIMFTAPDHATARRYYDSLRIVYHEHLLEKPVIIDVNFAFLREGKLNPKLENIYDFVPK